MRYEVSMLMSTTGSHENCISQASGKKFKFGVLALSYQITEFNWKKEFFTIQDSVFKNIMIILQNNCP